MDHQNKVKQNLTDCDTLMVIPKCLYILPKCLFVICQATNEIIIANIALYRLHFYLN